MQKEKNSIEVYQLKIMVCGISPTIWRRILMRSDTTIAELHYIIQIIFRWPNLHLHKFIISIIE